MLVTGQVKLSGPPWSPSWSEGAKLLGPSSKVHLDFTGIFLSLPSPNPWTTGPFVCSLTSKHRQIHQRCWHMVEVQEKPTWASCPTPRAGGPGWYLEKATCPAAACRTDAKVHLQYLWWKKDYRAACTTDNIRSCLLEELSFKSGTKNGTLTPPPNAEVLNSSCCDQEHASGARTGFAFEERYKSDPQFHKKCNTLRCPTANFLNNLSDTILSPSERTKGIETVDPYLTSRQT